MTSRETVWVDLGRTGYESAWDLQRQCVRARTSESIPDVVLHTEHDAVLTLGRGSDEANILSADLPRVRVERGGDVTYHGPGQSVLYPIVKLGEAQRDLHQLLRDLEEVVIRALSEFDVAGGRVPEKTGVWIGGAEDRFDRCRGFTLGHLPRFGAQPRDGSFDLQRPAALRVGRPGDDGSGARSWVGALRVPKRSRARSAARFKASLTVRSRDGRPSAWPDRSARLGERGSRRASSS